MINMMISPGISMMLRIAITVVTVLYLATTINLVLALILYLTLPLYLFLLNDYNNKLSRVSHKIQRQFGVISAKLSEDLSSEVSTSRL